MARLLAAALLLVASCGADPSDGVVDTESTDVPESRADDTEVVDTEVVDTEVVDTEVVDTEVVDTDDTDPPPCGVPDTDVDTDDPGCLFALAPPATEGDPLVFTTSGCWTVTIDHHTITMQDTVGTALSKVEHWGDPHENLNGKHVKDWEGDRRTILLPGGVIVTMHADGAQAVVETTSVYDGHNARTIDNLTNTVTASTDDPGEAATWEAGEADGEAATVVELTCEVVTYDQAYTQAREEDGTPLAKEPVVQQLGTTGGMHNPNQVNDFYDDPRLGHT